MQYSKLLLAAIALAAAGTAGAKDLALGDADDASLTFTFDHTSPTVLASAQPFADTVDFTLTGANDVDLQLNVLNNSKYSLAFTGWSLQKVGGGTVAAQPGSSLADLSYTGLGAGSYVFTVDGTLKAGTRGNKYTGQLVSSVTPVPEPESLALTLAGLAAVGFVVRRRG